MAIDPDKPHAFLSYTRFDDDYFKKGISWLREELEKAVQAHTGYPFQIFQDVEDIQPGDRWSNKLDQALKGAQLFIPILTPSFFQSDFCRREAQAFLDYETRAERDDLILPIYLIKASVMENSAQRVADEIAKALQERQHDDWRPLAVELQHVNTRHLVAAKLTKLADAIAQAAEKGGDAPPRELAEAAGHSEPDVEQPDTAADLAKQLEEARHELARVEQARVEEAAKLAWELEQARNTPQGVEADTASTDESALDVAKRERDEEVRNRLQIASEKRRLETFAAEAAKEASEDLAKLREENVRLEQLVAAGTTLPPGKAGLRISHVAMVGVAALVVGGAIASVLELGSDQSTLRAELESVRQQLSEAQAVVDADRTTVEAGAGSTDGSTEAAANPVGDPQPGDTFQDCPDCPELVVIPAGTFTMGSPATEAERRDNEGPQHEVTFEEPFALCKHEVTFDEWDACVAAGGCDHKPDDRGWGRGNRPVINVSWNDAQQYLGWLSEKTGATYRLPSEAEWEYAARAGTMTPFWTGETISTDQANYDGNYPYGDGEKGEDREKTISVGSFSPNPFGLHDMHGNVWEWVEDRYHQSYAGSPSDGSAWVSGDGTLRVLRGGSWIYFAQYLRSACRGAGAPGDRSLAFGFRCARVQE